MYILGNCLNVYLYFLLQLPGLENNKHYAVNLLVCPTRLQKLQIIKFSFKDWLFNIPISCWTRLGIPVIVFLLLSFLLLWSTDWEWTREQRALASLSNPTPANPGDTSHLKPPWLYLYTSQVDKWVLSRYSPLPVTLMGMMQEEMAWESAAVFWSDAGTFSLDQFVCLSRVEGALETEALTLWLPTTSPPSLSTVEVAWMRQTDRQTTTVRVRVLQCMLLITEDR